MITAPETHVGESIQQAIVRAVSAWPGVTTGPHRFGGVELRFGRRELGHEVAPDLDARNSCLTTPAEHGDVRARR